MSHPNPPLVSVITVCFNPGETLRPTLESILIQTYPSLELIVIDGGSTDGTVNALARMEDSRLRFESGPDGGIYDAMNKGVGLARGEYVNFMNAGDRFDDAEVLNDLFGEGAPDGDYVYGHVRSVFPTVTKISRSLPPATVTRRKPFNHQALFARRRWLLSEPFSLDFGIAGDYEQTYRAFRAGARLSRVDRVVATVDMRQGASKASLWANFLVRRQILLLHGGRRPATYRTLVGEYVRIGAVVALQKIGLFHTVMRLAAKRRSA